MLEVDADGEIVWEYFHPYGGPDITRACAPDNALFKARSYTREFVDPLLSN
jgi:hypothetical protein